MSRFTTTKTSLTDFLVSAGHVIETITLCVFAPTVGEYVNRTADSTIVVQAPTAIQRMAIDAQASISTSSTDEQKDDNEDQIIPVQVLIPAGNEKKKWPAKFAPKRWFRKHVKIPTNEAQSITVGSTTRKNRRNFFSLVIHGKKRIHYTERIDANDNLEREVETGELPIPTGTKELKDAHAKDDGDYGTAGDLNSMTTELDDDDRSISVRYLTACIAELQGEQEKRMQECGVVADDIPAMFLNHINQNITDENMKASMADAGGVYELGDMTLLVLFELPEVDDANRGYHATTTSTAPLADTTQSSPVSDAEADMSSPIENPAEHKTILSRADTSPRPNTGSTKEQVSLLAKDTIDRDLKLPVCVGESIHVTMHDVNHKTLESAEEHVVASEQRTSTLDELPLVTNACVECVECTENDNDGGMDWIDADISFGDILSRPYEPVSAHESTTAITAASAEAEYTPANTCDDSLVSEVSLTDIVVNTAAEHEINTIQALADTSPWPNAGPTNEQVSLLAKDTINNGVCDAEPDMSSPIENPADHETIRALADTSPEQNAGSTNEHVSPPLAKDYRDMQLPACVEESMQVTIHDVTHKTFESDNEHVVASEHCTSALDELPLVTYACVECTENDNDGGMNWIDADISFGDILSQSYEPVAVRECTTAITAVSAEAEDTHTDIPDDFFVSDVSFTDILFNTAAEHDINTIRPLADTTPERNEGSTNEQVSPLATDTIDRDMKLPVCAGESMHVTMHDVDWIEADISFGDILSQPYESVSAHESTTAMTAVSAEAEDTPADICDGFYVSDVSFTGILLNTVGRESENDSTPSEHSTDRSTTPMMGSGISSPVSTTATTPIEASDDTIVGSEKELFAEILFVNDEEWCLPAPDDDGCCSKVSVSSSVAAAEIERKTDITAPVTEYSHVVIPADCRALYIPVDAPVQDLESQDTHHVTPSQFASRTLSRVKSVLTSSFCSVLDTSETISDILFSFPPSIRRVLMSDLNTKDIFHGTCDHANPTGCANCSDKLDYLKRVRYGITASSCSDEDESVKMTRVRDSVLRRWRL
ncbi:hypothetical protein V1527DRAFT_449958 [Lipomyces starkeyi]